MHQSRCPGAFSGTLILFGDIGIIRFRSNNFTNVRAISLGVPLLLSVDFYFQENISTNCPATGCSVTVFPFDISARFGSVAGLAVNTQGVPVAGATIAAYHGETQQVVRQTTSDANGRYNFTLTDSGTLLNANQTYPGSTFVTPGTTISAGNNWGLQVDRDPNVNGPGDRTYALVASLGGTTFAAPGQRMRGVSSSKLVKLDLIVDAGDGDCPIPPLEPLVDPEAIRFEGANGNIVTYEDLNGVIRMDPSMLPDGGGNVGHIECLNQAVTAADGHFQLESAWRAPAYQRHLQDVYNKMLELKLTADPACDALRAEVANEMDAHDINYTGPRGAPTRHTEGKAIDIATNFGLPTTGSDSIDNLATGCELKRLIKRRLRDKDPGHLSLDGT